LVAPVDSIASWVDVIGLMSSEWDVVGNELGWTEARSARDRRGVLSAAGPASGQRATTSSTSPDVCCALRGLPALRGLVGR